MNLRAIVIGLICIVAAISGCLWYWLDGNPETNPDLEQTAAQVQTGISIIKTGETPSEKTFEIGPGVGVIVEEKK